MIHCSIARAEMEPQTLSILAKKIHQRTKADHVCKETNYCDQMVGAEFVAYIASDCHTN